MQRILATSLMALMLTALSGCGTMANMEGKSCWFDSRPPWSTLPPRPFGGVTGDGTIIAGIVDDFHWDSDAWILGAVAVLDMPLSFVGDIITLPWTINAANRTPVNAPDNKPGHIRP
jgi:uncharacterized protein YceK